MCKTITSLIFVLAFTVVACDDGPVDEAATFSQEGRNVKLTANVTGLDTWPPSFYVALAAFNDESDYAITSRRITEGDGTISTSLSGIGDEATRVELCVLNTLRQRVATFATLEGEALHSAADTIPFEAGTLSISMLAAVQGNVFNTTCIGCHGSNGGAAAGLFLTEGKSHAALISQASKKVEDGTLTIPGNAAQSVLYQVLTTDLSKGWHYDHTTEVTDTRRQKLILEWINAGAKE